MRLDFEKILNDNGLKVGDKIRLKNNTNLVYEIKIDDNNILYLKNINTEVVKDIQYLQFDFEKVEPKIEPKKTVGDLTCNDTCEAVGCIKCPLYCIACKGYMSITLREKLEESLKAYPQLEPMRPYLEKELDKEVEN